MFDPYIPDKITVPDPSVFAREPLYHIDPKRLPKTTTKRSGGFTVEDDIAYQIAVAHYGFRGKRSDFWLNDDTATKRLRDQVFGIRPPTGGELFDMVSSVGSGYRHRENTRATQKKKLKRRKHVLRKHRC